MMESSAMAARCATRQHSNAAAPAIPAEPAQPAARNLINVSRYAATGFAMLAKIALPAPATASAARTAAPAGLASRGSVTELVILKKKISPVLTAGQATAAATVSAKERKTLLTALLTASSKRLYNKHTVF
jgi:hypothetical protein